MKIFRLIYDIEAIFIAFILPEFIIDLFNLDKSLVKIHKIYFKGE